ncbi:FYVE zinc finger protein [Colletotrichum tofieldiae]|nr:FYVE zinc finger protein [Colletotrichum tofieldiae]GKT75859.1 FYVE zinc finger protein [Colletotrichum tofieldiae]GKT83560.1 FYVE zinc finger protein [Colletotrichum tofieldiae]
MECSRYFDCPTHVVERQLSDDEAEESDAGEDEPTVQLQMDDDTAEGSSSARLQTAEPTVSDDTPESIASFAPVPEAPDTNQPTVPVDSAQATSARDTEGPEESQDPEEAAPAPPTPLTYGRVCSAGQVFEFGSITSCKHIVARFAFTSSLVIESIPGDAASAASAAT